MSEPGVEYADRFRVGPFPARWGRPPVDDEQRALWAVQHVRRELADPMRALRRLEKRYRPTE